jgi:TfoX/Sxy family transcriptional regulator of competence genes
MSATFPYLIELVEESTAGLGDITKRRMFGCDALFTREQIFVLFWKTGRIGVRLPDPAAYAQLLALPGSEPWRIGEKTMSHWVLVPEDFHDDGSALTPWVRRAHALASSSPSSKTAKPAAAAKTTRSAKPAAAAKPAKPAKPAAAAKPAKPAKPAAAAKPAKPAPRKPRGA